MIDVMIDGFVRFAALTSTYMLVSTLIVYAIHNSSRPLLMRIYRMIVKIAIVILVLMLAIEVVFLQTYDHILIYVSLLIGNLMNWYILPPRK